MPRNPAAFFELARAALGTTQVGLGEALGVSRRTAQRWSDDGVPGHSLAALARVVHPRDEALAGEIALAAGTTLAALGLVRPAPSPAAAPAPAPPSAPDPRAPPIPPPPAAPPPPGMADAVVCATCEAMQMMPADVRPGLHAAFARAKELGLTVEFLERALGAALRTPRGADVRDASPDEARAVKGKGARG